MPTSPPFTLGSSPSSSTKLGRGRPLRRPHYLVTPQCQLKCIKRGSTLGRCSWGRLTQARELGPVEIVEWQIGRTSMPRFEGDPVDARSIRDGGLEARESLGLIRTGSAISRADLFKGLLERHSRLSCTDVREGSAPQRVLPVLPLRRRERVAHRMNSKSVVPQSQNSVKGVLTTSTEAAGGTGRPCRPPPRPPS